MDDRWKNEIRAVPDALLKPLYKIVCEQTNCMDRGFDEANSGKCAACADTAESVVGEFLALQRASHLA